MKKTMCTFLYGCRTVCTSVFSFIPQSNEKNQQSILKYLYTRYMAIGRSDFHYFGVEFCYLNLSINLIIKS